MTNFLLVGTVSNVYKYIDSEISHISKAIEEIGCLDIYLVESDSSDNTLEKLSEIQKFNQSLNYISLGSLRSELPDRIDRIRFCRNHYVKFIRENFEIRKWDYIIVADLDGMNSAITKRSIIRSLANHNKWEVCFANQTIGYYDLYALRAPGWVEQNCFSELRDMQTENIFISKFNNSFLNFLSAFIHFDKLRKKAIYSKMIRLKGELIPVDSAFGGFAIYKPEVFAKFDYGKVDSKSECEHLDLHAKCRRDGLRLVIDPKLKNNHWNEYNINKFLVIRFLRELRKFVQTKG